MSSKREKLRSKKCRRVEEQIEEYNSTKFVNVGVADKFTLILKSHSFVKEKTSHHLEDLFRKTIANKGWRALCRPPRAAVTIVVREFYANLTAHVVKKGQSKKGIGRFQCEIYK